jgi:hypothetical protein
VNGELEEALTKHRDCSHAWCEGRTLAAEVDRLREIVNGQKMRPEYHDLLRKWRRSEKQRQTIRAERDAALAALQRVTDLCDEFDYPSNRAPNAFGSGRRMVVNKIRAAVAVPTPDETED